MPLRPAPRRNSYVSEHTVEFYLVPEFTRVLAGAFDSILAFFYWASREGVGRERSIAPVKQVRLAAVFPRRPKRSVDGRQQFMKVNSEIFGYAAAFRRRGVPVFAGFPLVNSIFDFASAPRFSWFALVGQNENDIELPMPLKLEGPDALPASLRGPLMQDQVCQSVRDEATPLTWEEAISAIDHVRLEQKDDAGFWRFGPHYKPVYFAVW